MKRFFLLVFFSLLLRQLPALDASVSFSTFNSPRGPYVEVYLHVVGSTVAFLPLLGDTNQLQAAVEVVILFKKGEAIVQFGKYRLHSPISPHPINFVDLKRYALENGTYRAEVTLTDLNNPSDSRTYSSEVRVDYPAQGLGQSDIQLLASFRRAQPDEQSPLIKNGFFFECLPFHFYGRSADKLIFYNEIYNADRAIGDDYLITYKVERAGVSGAGETVLIGHKRRSPKPIDILLLQLDIARLPSGNYHLVVEVRNRENALLSKRAVFFQRSNPYLHRDRETIAQGADLSGAFVERLDDQELRYSLKALYPVLDHKDGELLNTLIKEKDPKAMRLYLFSFWATQNPTDPEKAYETYMQVARKVDEQFRNGFGYGFETDRGYIFMKYGAPDDVVTVEDDPVAPPYEIWVYNQFPYTNQRNVKFLFYNPSLATNGFILLHSNARGEVNNPRWEIELYGQAPMEIEGSNYLDGTRMQDNIGRRARRLFEDF